MEKKNILRLAPEEHHTGLGGGGFWELKSTYIKFEKHYSREEPLNN